MCRESRDLETLLRQTKETRGKAKNQAEIVEPKQTLQQGERRLLKLRQRADELEDSVEELEGRIRSSESHIQWALHNAMQEADLLEPHTPLTPFTMTDTESRPPTQKEINHDTGEKAYDTGDIAANGVGDAAHHCTSREDTDDTPEELQSIRQTAWESYNKALVTMHTVQSPFDTPAIV